MDRAGEEGRGRGGKESWEERREREREKRGERREEERSQEEGLRDLGLGLGGSLTLFALQVEAWNALGVVFLLHRVLLSRRRLPRYRHLSLPQLLPLPPRPTPHLAAVNMRSILLMLSAIAIAMSPSSTLSQSPSWSWSCYSHSQHHSDG